MKKIRITIISSSEEEYPGCRDILSACAEFEVIACYSSMTEVDIWQALSRSDVVLLDEAAIRSDYGQAVRRVHEVLPFARILLILDKMSKNKTMEALSLGVTGVIERDSMVSSIRKAIPVLYSGESWVSRRIVKSLHSQLKHAGDDSFFPQAIQSVPDRKKLN